jgi:hypothetical protein
MSLTDLFYDPPDFFMDTIQIVCLVILIIQGLRMSRKNQGGLIYKLIVGAFCCYLMGAVFWFFYYGLTGDWPQVFSAADLSWLGFYSFMLAANLSLIEKWTEEQKHAAKKTRLPALAVPVVALWFHIQYVLDKEGILVNNISSFVLIALWGYFSLMPLLAFRKSPARYYYLLSLLTMILELLIFLFSYSVSYGVLYYVFSYMQIIVWFFLFPAARKAVET